MKGTYIEATDFTPRTISNIKDLINSLDVPNHAIDFHTTITYSRKSLPISLGIIAQKHVAVSDKLEIFESENERVLVLRLISPDLQKSFEHYIKLGATYDYDEYKPHITLSTDLGDWQLEAAYQFGIFPVISNSISVSELDLDHE